MSSEAFDLEAVYDEQINPLMKQIIDICKKHDLPFVASFQYSSNGKDDNNFCSTAVLPDKKRPVAQELNEMYGILTGVGRRGPALNLTVRDKDGKITSMETIIP